MQGRALHDLFTIAVETSPPAEAQELARLAFRAYGPRHPKLPALAHDVAYFWMGQGRFEPALEVFRAVMPHLHDPNERCSARRTWGAQRGPRATAPAFDDGVGAGVGGAAASGTGCRWRSRRCWSWRTAPAPCATGVARSAPPSPRATWGSARLRAGGDRVGGGAGCRAPQAGPGAARPRRQPPPKTRRTWPPTSSAPSARPARCRGRFVATQRPASAPGAGRLRNGSGPLPQSRGQAPLVRFGRTIESAEQTRDGLRGARSESPPSLLRAPCETRSFPGGARRAVPRALPTPAPCEGLYAHSISHVDGRCHD